MLSPDVMQQVTPVRRIPQMENVSGLTRSREADPGPTAAPPQFQPGAWKTFQAERNVPPEVRAKVLALEGMVDQVRDGGRNAPAMAQQLMKALSAHLANAGTGPGSDMFADIPKRERVPLLQKAVFALMDQVDTRPGILTRAQRAELDQMKHEDQVLAGSFDWDDNILFMPTTIRVFDRRPEHQGQFKDLSTGEFAEVGKKLGKEGEWQHYEIRPDSAGVDASFAGFRDFDPQSFSRAAHGAMLNGQMSPKALAFFATLADPKNAEHASIITARGHSPQTIRNTLLAFQHLYGVPKHVPKEENIFPVHNPEVSKDLGAGSATNPAGGKGAAAMRLLDAIDTQPFGPQATPVYGPDGSGERNFFHLYSFSDDDRKNYDKMAEALGAEMKKGRWPNTKILLEFTSMRGGQAPETKVLTPEGKARDPLPGELDEFSALQIDRMARTFGAHKKLPPPETR